MNAKELLAVRSINAHVFCPRLFWLEEKAGLFEPNEHTHEGEQAHQRVDQGGGKMPAPALEKAAKNAPANEGEGDSKEESEAEERPWQTRDLWLSSPRLGISGKLDLAQAQENQALENQEDTERAKQQVMPVDTKKGKAPKGKGLYENDDDTPNGLWPADEVQLICQAMLLEEAGYQVQEVAAYYRAERRRVRVPLTQAMREKAKAEIALAGETLQLETPPLPLLDSPKCRGCSLNAICQPDEINALTGRSSWEAAVLPSFMGADPGMSAGTNTSDTSTNDEANCAPPAALRRVVPMNADARPLVVSIPGARVGIRKDSLTITPPELRLRKGEKPPEKPVKIKVQKVGLSQVSHVAILGTAQMSSQALRACMEAGLTVSFSSTGGRVYGMASGEEPHGVYVRRAQHAAFPKDGPTPVAMGIAKVLIADKVANQRVMLRRNIRALDDEDAEAPLARLQKLVQEISSLSAGVDSPQLLLAKEGEAAKLYWKSFSKLCARDDDVFAMKGRTKRPPEDETNAMISFCAGLLVRDCKLAVRAAQLDGQLGVFHTPHHGRPSMALDLMEPFRPLVIDSVVLGVIRRGEVQARGFVHTGQAVVMKQPTRKALIVAYERRMAELIAHPTFGYRISYRQVLAVQARLLARVLVGELDKMPSFRTR